MELSYYIIDNNIYHFIKMILLDKTVISFHYIAHIKHINQMSNKEQQNLQPFFYCFLNFR